VRGFGGSGPYAYAFVPTGGPAPTSFTATTTFEIPGPYSQEYDFYVQDANGCTALVTQLIEQADGVADPQINVVNQCTATSGYQIDMISPLTTGPEPENTFQYNIGSGFQSGTTFIVPNPGTYTITVRDGNGCTNTVEAEVFDFFSITADASSLPTCNAGDGTITVTTSGGSGDFEYQLIDGGTNTDIGGPQSDPQIHNLPPGYYKVLRTDLESNTIPL